VGVFPDGSVQYYNGTSWISIAPADTVSSFGSWNKFRLEANKTAANVYVNDAYIGVAGMRTNPANVTSLNGFQFLSGGTVPSGDDIYIDYIYFGK
jgi:hypothetical protein